MSKNDWMNSIGRAIAVILALRGSNGSVSVRTGKRKISEKLGSKQHTWVSFDQLRFSAELETRRYNPYTNGSHRYLR